MKKILFSLLTFVLLVNITYAMDLSLKFKSESSYPPVTINRFYKDGYIFVDTTNVYEVDSRIFKTTISYYDSNGKFISEKDFDFITEAVVVDGDDLYLFVTKENPHDSYSVSQKYIVKLDSNFNIKKEYYINENVSSTSPLVLCNFERVDIKNNEILIRIEERSNLETYYFKVDKDLNNITQVSTTPFEEEEVLKELQERISYDFFEIHKNKDRYVTLKYVPTNCIRPDACIINYALIQYDKNLTKTWEAEIIKDYKFIFDVATNDKYIIIYGVPKSSNKASVGNFLIYDYNGNLIKTINNVEASSRSLALNEKELIYTEAGASGCFLGYFEEKHTCYPEGKHVVYKIIYDIITSVKEGKGKINVVPFAQPGDGISVEITPDDGYVLSEAIVTDALGNKIKFTDYKFTMPSDDVLIEAIFVKAEQKENPKTADAIITTSILLFILSFIVLIVQKKRKTNVY